MQLLCQVPTVGNEVPNVMLVARPHAFASEKAAEMATPLLRRLERPIDLVLAGSGRHCGKAGHFLASRCGLSVAPTPLLTDALVHHSASRACFEKRLRPSPAPHAGPQPIVLDRRRCRLALRSPAWVHQA